MDRHLGRQTYYQLAALAIASGLVAGVAGGLVAQPAGNTGHPGSVTIEDTSAAALDVAGGIEAGSGHVQIVDASGGMNAAHLTTGTLPRARLATGTGDSINSTPSAVTLNEYSFFPNLNQRSCDGAAARGTLHLAPNLFGTVGRVYVDATCATQGLSPNNSIWQIQWRYLSASDTPSVWVVREADGTVVAVWESEDPVSAGDTVAPLATDEATHTVVNMGVPSLAVITTLTDALTADQQADLLTRLNAYVAAQRGWLTAVTALADLATIAPRYEPSGRQWAMRRLAEVQGVAVAELYQTALRVDPLTDTWGVAPR